MTMTGTTILVAEALVVLFEEEQEEQDGDGIMAK